MGASPRNVAKGHFRTHALHQKAQLFVGLPTSPNEDYAKKDRSRLLLGDDENDIENASAFKVRLGA
jgi:hypothetical protein